MTIPCNLAYIARALKLCRGLA